jgi:hypothetical protein
MVMIAIYAADLIRETCALAIEHPSNPCQNLHDDFHEIFSLTEWPVQYFEERAGKQKNQKDFGK